MFPVQVCTPRSKNIHLSWMRIDHGLRQNMSRQSLTTLPKFSPTLHPSRGTFVIANRDWSSLQVDFSRGHGFGSRLHSQKSILVSQTTHTDMGQTRGVSTANLQLHTSFREDGNQRVDAFRCQLCLKARKSLMSGDPENSYRVNSDV